MTEVSEEVPARLRDVDARADCVRRHGAGWLVWADKLAEEDVPWLLARVRALVGERDELAAALKPREREPGDSSIDGDTWQGWEPDAYEAGWEACKAHIRAILDRDTPTREDGEPG